MKKKITLVMMLLLAVMGVKADVIPSSYYSEPAAGTFFIYNVTEGKFLMTLGISENNRALQTIPQAVTLTSNGDGTYKFSGNKDCFVKVGTYSDQWLWPNGTTTDVLPWTFNLEGTKTYKISANVTSVRTSGTYYITNISNLGDKDDATNAGVYALITPDSYKTYLWDNDIIIPEKYYSAAPDEAGEYYLYDMVNNKFLNTANRTLNDVPSSVTFTPSGGNYLISGNGSGNYLKIGVSGTQYLWSDGNNTNTFWTLAKEAGDSKNIFYIHTTNFTETNGAVKDKDMYLIGTNASSTSYGFSQWALITAANYTAYLEANAAKANKATIAAADGDATSFISNPTFDSSDKGWSGGARKDEVNTWRGNNGADYESTSDNVTFSQTLSNMPRGTYKLVAAVRGDNGTTATAQINGTSGTTITNGGFDTSRQQINLNGVQMPYSSMGGFNTGTNALGWQWATATYTLSADGDLTISFLMTGAKWKGVDDVHLYYMSDGSNTYAVNYSDNVNNNGHVVTCDLQTDNPNRIFVASSDIYTATSASTIMNNLRVSTGWINKLVLYDGYEVSIPANSRSVNSTLYRNIAAGSFATICCPFAVTSGADGTFYKPESLSGEGVLNFETVASPEGGKAYLYKASSAVSALTHSGDHWLAENVSDNGTGVVMKGTYTKIDAIDNDNYVLSSSNLYKVNSTVSCNPFRAYFNIPSAGVKANVLSLNFDGIETGIDMIQGEGVTINGSIYNLAGQRVNNPKRGLYIVNGKKVIVK